MSDLKDVKEIIEFVLDGLEDKTVTKTTGVKILLALYEETQSSKEKKNR